MKLFLECVLITTLPSFLAISTSAQECGAQNGSASCDNNLCCSQFGWCGSTGEYCGAGCQNGPCDTSLSSDNDAESIITSALFDQMLKHRNDSACPARGFYTYDAFTAAADLFDGFGTTGNLTSQKRELAAFFAQTSHETTGGWATAPDGPFAWGYCFKQEQTNPLPQYCNDGWPCPAGKSYYGRGPIQLTHNYNYQQAGDAIGVDLINNPDLVATDPTISFKTAIWFWMKAQANKPSSHDVIVGAWTPSATDIAAKRLPAGLGVITNIINGRLECGKGQDPRVADRIGFYKRYCDMLGVSYGPNLDCYNQQPFA